MEVTLVKTRNDEREAEKLWSGGVRGCDTSERYLGRLNPVPDISFPCQFRGSV
ncbi:hypothetical protein B0H19DRAFT_1104333, partial [Mycena capillaripes]